MVRITQIPFQGFYETGYSQIVDDEIERFFNYDECGNVSNIPDELYFECNYKSIFLEIARWYVDRFQETYEDLTGVKLGLLFESMDSPKYYNYETDRIFCGISEETINELWRLSVENKHEQLEEQIKDRYTSYDGFCSFYSNKIEEWLEKPLEDWDHNELETLLLAVLSITNSEKEINEAFSSWRMLEDITCNGDLHNWICAALPKEMVEFSSIQYEAHKPLDYEIWKETGVLYEEGSNEPLPPLRCKFTKELNLEEVCR